MPAPSTPRRAAERPACGRSAAARRLTSGLDAARLLTILFLTILFIAASQLACVVASTTPPATSPTPPSATSTRPPGEPTRILSAQMQPVLPGQRDYFGLPVAGLLYVVFSRPLDPAGLAPGRFVVLTDEGTRRVPFAARLAPASERDELRALELVVPAPARNLLSVTVAGQLFDADGRDLEGLAADVTPSSAPPVPVAADRVEGGLPECPGEHVLRVWWSVPVQPGPAPARLQLRAGGSLTPTHLADLACKPIDRLESASPGCDVEDDNVIDLCFAPAGAPLSLELPPDAARDRQGRPSPAARIDFPHTGP